MGTDLKRKAYLIGFYMMLLMVVLAFFRPANLEKSNILVVLDDAGTVSEVACRLKAANVRDSVLSATLCMVSLSATF